MKTLIVAFMLLFNFHTLPPDYMVLRVMARIVSIIIYYHLSQSQWALSVLLKLEIIEQLKTTTQQTDHISTFKKSSCHKSVTLK